MVFDVILGGDIVVKKFFSEKVETFLVFLDTFEILFLIFVEEVFNCVKFKFCLYYFKDKFFH